MVLYRVKYSCLMLLLFSAVMTSFGQSGSFKVNWQAPKYILDSIGQEIEVLNCEGASYSDENNYLPSVVIRLQGNVIDFKINQTSLVPLSSDEQKVKLNSFPSASYKIQYGHLNGKLISYVYFIPLENKSGSVEKISSFEYSYQIESTPQNLASKTSLFKIAASSANSVLATGTWHKLYVNNSGLYKIDYNFLTSLGLNPDNINPAQIQIYGNGGGMLPQLNSAFRYDDLVENAIYSVDVNNDGVFNTDDYVLFYAQGPNTWSLDMVNKLFVHTKNIYSDVACYFLTIGSGSGLRVQDQTAPTGAPAQTISVFDERYFHENDNENVLHSGREWYGEVFDYETSQSFSANIPDIVPNTTLKYKSFVMGKSYYSSSFNVYLNGSFIGSQSISALSTASYSDVGNNSINTFSVSTNSISGSSIGITYNYNKGASSSATGYLNYFEINVQRQLKLYNGYLAFRSIGSTTATPTQFDLANATSDVIIWDVTTPVKPENISYTFSGSTASFLSNTDTLREFIAFTPSVVPSLSTPSSGGVVANQNLHSIGASSSVPQLLIVTHSDFLSAAKRLADYRTTHDNMNVEVVTVDQVYNEFSSGCQDITGIRDFARMIYYRSTPTDSLKYLLLFGSCSYDYKNRISGNTNFVPVYELRESLNPINSQSSDDYYGFFDSNEGNWEEPISKYKSTPWVGIGRLTVTNSDEADNVVNKIINYSNNIDCLGEWRNKITFVADDGDGNLHLNGADELANFVDTAYTVYNLNKIYLDAYPQESDPGGEVCPPVNSAIDQAIEQGTFIMNYTGHGGEQVWAQERILTLNQINNYNNFNALPFFVTATCDFGRYDDPGTVSGAEHLLINSKGGAIGLISSTRPVYSSSNSDLNKALYKCIFKSINGQMPRLGDIIRFIKNDPTVVSGFTNRNYALLADPSLMLAYPKDNIVITQLNGNSISSADTLRALSKVKIDGEVRDGSGAKMSSFNGSVYLTVFDKPSIITTLGTQGSSPTTFKLSNNLIFEGNASVTNGSFSISFVVPKDISYQFANGKISLYAREDGNSIDANGYNFSIIIGGTDTSFAADNTPPQIKLYMNDESFVFGGLTSPNSLFLAELFDSSGINIAGQGIGHEITAVLDNSTDVMVLNQYYSANKNSYQQGAVKYPFKDLTPGSHSIKFKCWDTYNNSSEAYLEFIVANDAKIALDHILNFPNPFSTRTTFHFDHNRAGDDLEVLVQVYTISGTLIKTLDSRVFASESHFSDITWDGRDDFGDKIGIGVYVYKVRVKSLRDGSEISKFQKLVLLN